MFIDDEIELIKTKTPTVAVVGDMILDGWFTGSFTRFAREAAVPVYEPFEKKYQPGGAANTAINLTNLGAKTHAIGVVGCDSHGDNLCLMLEREGVETKGIARSAEITTTTKLRLSLGSNMFLRLDDIGFNTIAHNIADELLNKIEKVLPDVNALIICDYGSNIFSQNFIRRLACLPRPNLVVVDAHNLKKWSRLVPDLVTPNLFEAEKLIAEKILINSAEIGYVKQLKHKLLSSSNAQCVALTLDKNGTLIFRDGYPIIKTTTKPVPERQASGAGDVHVAAFTTALASGCSVEKAANFSQKASDIAVQKEGTCTCSLSEMLFS